jgi:hypothetical protein
VVARPVDRRQEEAAVGEPEPRLLQQLPRELGVAARAQRDRDGREGAVGQVGARGELEVRGSLADRRLRPLEQVEIEERAVDAALPLRERRGDGELRAAGGRAGDRAVRQLVDAPDQDRLGRARRLRPALARELDRLGTNSLSNRTTPAAIGATSRVRRRAIPAG